MRCLILTELSGVNQVRRQSSTTILYLRRWGSQEWHCRSMGWRLQSWRHRSILRWGLHSWACANGRGLHRRISCTRIHRDNWEDKWNNNKRIRNNRRKSHKSELHHCKLIKLFITFSPLYAFWNSTAKIYYHLRKCLEMRLINALKITHPPIRFWVVGREYISQFFQYFPRREERMRLFLGKFFYI